MLNLSKIQLQLEKAKEGLREVEENIQKVEGKTFSNGSARFGGLKVEVTPNKGRNASIVNTPGENRRRRFPSGNYEQRNQYQDFEVKSFRGPEKRDQMSGPPGKRLAGEGRPQGVFARLSGMVVKAPVEEDEDEELPSKPSLSSRVFATASEAPSRQEVIAAQTQDEQSKQRNRRMFGALVGTLHKFRKEETRVREREEKRLKVEKKLEEDAKREKEMLVQEKRALFVERKRREVEIKRIEWSLKRVKEFETWEASMLPLHNFIQTQAKPHIFYLPRVHTPKTEERLAISQTTVQKIIEKRRINLKEEIESSEKKARRNMVDAGDEEAENIPQEDDCGEIKGGRRVEEVGVLKRELDKQNEFQDEDGEEEEEEDYPMERVSREKGKVDSEAEFVEADEEMEETHMEEGEVDEGEEAMEVERTGGEVAAEIENRTEEQAEAEEGSNPINPQNIEDEAEGPHMEVRVERQDLHEKHDTVGILHQYTTNTGDIGLPEEAAGSGETKAVFTERTETNKVDMHQNEPAVAEDHTGTDKPENTKTELPESKERKREDNDRKRKVSESSRKRDRSRSRSRSGRATRRSRPSRSPKSRRRSSPRRSPRQRPRRRGDRPRSQSKSPRRRTPRRRSRSTSRKRSRRSPGQGKKRAARSSSSSSPSPRRRGKSSSSSN